MINLTHNAIMHLKDLLTAQPDPTGKGLRLQVEKGGCAGFQYAMRLDTARPEDQIFTEGGVSLIVDQDSYGFLDGSTLDYVDSLNDAGFKVENPNAARNCGCGTSFEPKASEASIMHKK